MHQAAQPLVGELKLELISSRITNKDHTVDAYKMALPFAYLVAGWGVPVRIQKLGKQQGYRTVINVIRPDQIVAEKELKL